MVNGTNGNGGPAPPPPHYLHELPQSEEERLEKLFKTIDADNNGRIDIRDLTQALHETGVHQGYAKVIYRHGRCQIYSWKPARLYNLGNVDV